MSNMTGNGGSSNLFSGGNNGGGSTGANSDQVFQQKLLLNHHHHHSFKHSPNSSTTTHSNDSFSSDYNQQFKPPVAPKKKRNQPGNPDPTAEVIALSPESLMATNRFICEICNKGFQRDQNLQLHRRGHNLPWKLKVRPNNEIKKRVYICPEPTCVHHNPARALGDLTGIKKHFCRKHCEKKWKCDKCNKKYAVQSDWKAHIKTCGTKEYKCDCGTVFSRRDSFITHRAFCDALAEENQNQMAAKIVMAAGAATPDNNGFIHHQPADIMSKTSSSVLVKELFQNSSSSTTTTTSSRSSSSTMPPSLTMSSSVPAGSVLSDKTLSLAVAAALFGGGSGSGNGADSSSPTASMSATALLQKAAQIGATASNGDQHQYGGMNMKMNSPMMMNKSSMATPPPFFSMQPPQTHHQQQRHHHGLLTQLLMQQKPPAHHEEDSLLADHHQDDQLLMVNLNGGRERERDRDQNQNKNQGSHLNIGGFLKFHLENQQLKKYNYHEPENETADDTDYNAFLFGATDSDTPPAGDGGNSNGVSNTYRNVEEMTVDFMGVNGGGGGGSGKGGGMSSDLHDQLQHHQKKQQQQHHDDQLKFNDAAGIGGQPLMEGLKQFHQLHAAASMEKSMWEVSKY